MKLEVVLENTEEVKVALDHRVDRIELVSAFDLGGLTPGAAMIKACAALTGELQVMIRPRAGAFCYSASELEIMKEEIRIAAGFGSRGVVFGCLDENDRIRKQAVEQLFRVAQDLQLESTFHRAIDFCANQDEALDFLQELGFKRILSAGSTSTVDSGYAQLRQLLDKTGGRPGIIAAGGVNQTNILPLFEMKLDSIHFAIRQLKEIPANYRLLGNEYSIDNEKINYICQLKNKKTE
ncbi:MAG: copper homeostasis protein CutC [Bacteroidota bacterium]